jgi:hypothetical protein
LALVQVLPLKSWQNCSEPPFAHCCPLPEHVSLLPGPLLLPPVLLPKPPLPPGPLLLPKPPLPPPLLVPLDDPHCELHAETLPHIPIC